jgi:cell wall-associated NlpC family hydrolase
MLFLNSAYLWGGRSIFGVDCSGFCQTVFRFIGIPLLRDAYQQASQGEAIGFLEETKLGDLAFFDNEEGRITHVGMLLDQDTIIHASGRVRMDTIDHLGIVNVDTGLHTHKLRIIKRMLK